MFKVIYSHRAQKNLKKIPGKQQKKILQSIEILQNNPYIGKSLQGELANKYSLRIWPYRIIYSIQKKMITITIINIGHRQHIYK